MFQSVYAFLRIIQHNQQRYQQAFIVSLPFNVNLRNYVRIMELHKFTQYQPRRLTIQTQISSYTMQAYLYLYEYMYVEWSVATFNQAKGYSNFRRIFRIFFKLRKFSLELDPSINYIIPIWKIYEEFHGHLLNLKRSL